jgi:hypothetical protein
MANENSLHKPVLSTKGIIPNKLNECSKLLNHRPAL